MRIDSAAPAENPDRSRRRKLGALSEHPRFTNKKEDRFSPEKARVLICHSSSALVLQSRVLSLEVSSGSISFCLLLSFSLSYYTCIDDNCANSSRTYRAIRLELRSYLYNFLQLCGVRFPITEVSFFFLDLKIFTSMVRLRMLFLKLE